MTQAAVTSAALVRAAPVVERRPGTQVAGQLRQPPRDLDLDRDHADGTERLVGRAGGVISTAATHRCLLTHRGHGRLRLLRPPCPRGAPRAARRSRTAPARRPRGPRAAPGARRSGGSGTITASMRRSVDAGRGRTIRTCRFGRSPTPRTSSSRPALSCSQTRRATTSSSASRGRFATIPGTIPSSGSGSSSTARRSWAQRCRRRRTTSSSPEEERARGAGRRARRGASRSRGSRSRDRGVRKGVGGSVGRPPRGDDGTGDLRPRGAGRACAAAGIAAPRDRARPSAARRLAARLRPRGAPSGGARRGADTSA